MWRDVLVQSEEVVWVVPPLQSLEPLVLRRSIGLADALLTLVHQEVHIDAGVVGL